MLWPSESACGSKEFNAPFPVSPSGGKPGRAGSPHAGSTLLASKGGWQASMLPAPPTRGLPPPCGSPASAVLVQTAVSIKPELSIWLTTGTFYLALTDRQGAQTRTLENWQHFWYRSLPVAARLRISRSLPVAATDISLPGNVNSQSYV